MSTKALTVRNPDSHGIATEVDLPRVWEEMNSIHTEDDGAGLVPLESMDSQQKRSLLICAVNDSKWVAEDRLDPGVQRGHCLMEVIATCLNKSA